MTTSLILLIDDVQILAQPTPNRHQRQHHRGQALAAVAEAGTFAQIEDAGAWQREVRADRAHLGRVS